MGENRIVGLGCADLLVWLWDRVAELRGCPQRKLSFGVKTGRFEHVTNTYSLATSGPHQSVHEPRHLGTLEVFV